jgi:hypothetical protein
MVRAPVKHFVLREFMMESKLGLLEMNGLLQPATLPKLNRKAAMVITAAVCWNHEPDSVPC